MAALSMITVVMITVEMIMVVMSVSISNWSDNAPRQAAHCDNRKCFEKPRNWSHS